MNSIKSVKLVLVILSFFSVISLHANEWGLEQLLSLFAGQGDSKVSFVEERTNAMLRKPIITKGLLIHRNNNILEKQITFPYRETYLIEGDTIRIISADDKVKRIVALSDHPVLAIFIESFRSVLTGNINSLRKHYSIELVGAEKSWRMVLVPKNETARDYVEKVVITGSKSLVNKISVTEPSGGSSIMTLVQ